MKLSQLKPGDRFRRNRFATNNCEFLKRKKDGTIQVKIYDAFFESSWIFKFKASQIVYI